MYQTPFRAASGASTKTKLSHASEAASPAGHDPPDASVGEEPTPAPSASQRERDDQLREIVARARKGDRRAFDQLLVALRPRAMAVAVKVLRNPDDAEDAVQDAFVKVWRYLDRFEGRASFATWIHRIVMNACLDILRRHSARPEMVSVESDDSETNANRASEPSHEETPERFVGQAQTSAIVHAALACLSAAHRQTLTLRELEDQSYEEIAQAVRIPVGTVMSRLHHARRRLADELRDVPDLTLCAA
jgi:RNA polymerase sigma-70 factor, ECF subfamily